MRYFLVVATFLMVGIFPAAGQSVQISSVLSLQQIDSYGIIGDIGDRSYTYTRNNDDVYLQAYDKDMRLLWDRALKLIGSRRSVAGVIARDNSVQVVYTYLEEKKRDLIVDEFGLDAERIDSHYVAKNIDRSMGEPFEFALSDDEEKLFFYYLRRNRDLTGFMFDQALDTTIWDIQISYENLKFNEDLQGVLVSEYGEAFIIFDDNNDRYKKDQHALYIEVIRSTGELSDYIDIPVDSLVYTSSSYHWSDITRKITTVHLTNKKSKSGSQAVASYSINPYQKDSYTHTYLPFTSELLNAYFRTERTSRDEIEHLDIKEFVPRQDGGWLLLAEASRQVFRSNYSLASRDYLGGSGNIDYFYEDMVALGVHPDGTLHWSHVLRKKQYSYGDQGVYSSFGVIKTPKRLRLLFNDEIKRENTVSEYILNGQGVLRRFSVMNTQYKTLGLRLSSGFQTGPLTFIAPSEVGNDLQFVKFKFN